MPDDLTCEDRVLLRIVLWFEWRIARGVVRWFRWRGQHARAVMWAYKHYGRRAGRAVLR